MTITAIDCSICYKYPKLYIMKLKIAYIAHPISGDVKGNIEKINAIVREINLNEPNTVPFVPYLSDLLALNDEIPEERERGIKNNIRLIQSGIVDEIRLYGDTVSKGMLAEINLAKSLNIRVRSFSRASMDYDTVIGYL